jgi:hypothetical protein
LSCNDPLIAGEEELLFVLYWGVVAARTDRG